MLKLWEASSTSIQKSKIYEFALLASERTGLDLRTWDKLYKWSITDLSSFWQLCSDFVNIQWMQAPDTSFVPPLPGKMRGAQWFPGGTLNFCKNILPPADDRIVIESLLEAMPEEKISGLRLHNEVSKLAQFLKEQGIAKNDVVSGIVGNSYHAIAAMLATASLGAVWSSCSPDFGAEAILDRLGQVQPKLCFFTLSYAYNGRLVDCTANLSEILRSIKSLKTVVGIPGPLKVKNEVPYTYESIVASVRENAKGPALPIRFEETSFDHPLYILFSSGTTGVPKCIVHGAGGTLLQHKKEHILHCDLGYKDHLFFFTTCGWMMWNWMVSALGVGSSLLVFDGSPRLGKQGLWETVSKHKVTVFGTSPKFISLSRSESWCPKKSLDFSNLRSILSTGSPLLPEHGTWVMENVKSDLHLASISGGTDIVSCFMLGNSMLPVYAGEIQAPGLGMAVEAYDENGKSLVQEKGDLVCTKPFPAMPVYFLKDPDGKKYHTSYFSFFENLEQEVWRHGDYISVTEHGGIIVHGRSDATLNPGGVRIGSSELYRCVEALEPVEDSLAVSYEFEKGDPVILLFVKLKSGFSWSKDMEDEIKKSIRKNLSARHVPHRIFPVQEIPYTRNGKKVELAVSKTLCGLDVPNLSALSNPRCLDEYTQIRDTQLNSK